LGIATGTAPFGREKAAEEATVAAPRVTIHPAFIRHGKCDGQSPAVRKLWEPPGVLASSSRLAPYGLAEKHFELASKTRAYFYFDYFWSKALLQRLRYNQSPAELAASVVRLFATPGFADPCPAAAACIRSGPMGFCYRSASI
jgi:hypothetical protein